MKAPDLISVPDQQFHLKKCIMIIMSVELK